MDQVREIVIGFFAVDSIWSVVFRGGIWFAIAMVIIISTDAANPEKSVGKLKANLGFFILFLALSTALMYLLFGVNSVPASAAA